MGRALLIALLFALAPAARAGESPEVRTAAHAHYQAGRAHLAEGRIEEAIGELKAAVTLSPRQPTAHFYLGEAWRAKGARETALHHYSRNLEFDPTGEKAEEVRATIARLKSELEAERRPRSPVVTEPTRPPVLPNPAPPPSEPTVEPRERPSTPAHKKWWVWTLAGVGVVGGGLGLGLGLTLGAPRDAPVPGTDLGAMRVPWQ